MVENGRKETTKELEKGELGSHSQEFEIFNFKVTRGEDFLIDG